jgi:hypothetical protein
MKPTNLDIKDTACRHVIHYLQHPISRPSTWLAQDTMVKDLKINFSPFLAGKYGKSTKYSTR